MASSLAPRAPNRLDHLAVQFFPGGHHFLEFLGLKRRKILLFTEIVGEVVEMPVGLGASLRIADQLPVTDANGRALTCPSEERLVRAPFVFACQVGHQIDAVDRASFGNRCVGDGGGGSVDIERDDGFRVHPTRG